MLHVCCVLILEAVRAIPEKNNGWWLVQKDLKKYGSLVFDQIKLHWWLVFRCVEGEERILSAKNREKFYQI